MAGVKAATSKPSHTNCPCSFTLLPSLWNICGHLACFSFPFRCQSHNGTSDMCRKTSSGGYSAGAPPLPIPNREVKPGRADGTAPQCGRVGRRLLSGEPSRKRGGSCFLCSFSIFFQILRLSVARHLLAWDLGKSAVAAPVASALPHPSGTARRRRRVRI